MRAQSAPHILVVCRVLLRRATSLPVCVALDTVVRVVRPLCFGWGGPEAVNGVFMDLVAHFDL